MPKRFSQIKIFPALILCIACCFTCCKNEPAEITPGKKREMDSLSRTEQRRQADSMKKGNPLLIVPPDSEYTGDYTDKYESGVIKFRGFFRFGKRHGQWMSFYPDGVLWSELHYEKGLRHGPNITYYTNGKKRYEGFYRDDQQDSLWTYYDTSGVVVEKVRYARNKIVKRLP
jgi:antitoxin component YwqK of YwqJK toxin-antitoxin module